VARLVVRGAPAPLAQVKRALEDLDPPPRSLWITVDQEMNPSITGRSAEFTVESREDGGVEGQRTRTLVGGKARDRAETSSTSTERLRVLEGHRAFVHIGRAVPVPSTG